MEPVENMFENMTAEIFKEAGVTKEQYPWAWDQCKEILSAQMAKCSVLYGLSQRRVEVFEKQKQTLIEDLIKLKKKDMH
jgi:hypothetical protein